MTRALRRAWNRLVRTFFGCGNESDLAEEIDVHIQLLAEENIGRGLPPEEAYRRAKLQFGCPIANVELDENIGFAHSIPGVLSRVADAPVAGQGRAGTEARASAGTRSRCRDTASWRASSPVRAACSVSCARLEADPALRTIPGCVNPEKSAPPLAGVKMRIVGDR